MASYLRVKICGVTEEVDAVQAAELGADAIGLNFYKGSPRYIAPAKAESIMRILPPFVEPVGIFVSTELPPEYQIVTTLHLRTIQFHQFHWSNECFVFAYDPRICAIPAFSVSENNDLQSVRNYLDRCRQEKVKLPAAILVDARVPGQYGGTGRTAPWNLLADFHPGVPVILAGGLTPENVAEAIRIVRPYGVDVASGVEKSPGQKDAEKMKRFIETAREAAAK
jgi:phosphoribosylanthranilate isomerase